MAIKYMVDMATCPDAATREAIAELRLVVQALRVDLDGVTGNISSDEKDLDEKIEAVVAAAVGPAVADAMAAAAPKRTTRKKATPKQDSAS